MIMNQDPALTPARLDALNAVDLQLIGVTYGITTYAEDYTPRVEGGSADDFDRLIAVASKLNAERGDRLAVEPTGFRSNFVEELTLANILPANVPDIPVADMPQALHETIVAFLENGRRELYLNNLLYTAAHTLLRGVPVQRAEVSREEWETFEKVLPDIALPDAQDKLRLFYRNTKMLARLGDIAVDMAASKREQQANGAKPVLLFASGATHTPRLAERLLSKVSFRANM